jgi:hypothetical protein
MRFYDVPVNQSVPTEANRSLTSYRVKVCCFDVGVLLGRVSRLADAHGNMSYQLVHAVGLCTPNTISTTTKMRL